MLILSSGSVDAGLGVAQEIMSLGLAQEVPLGDAGTDQPGEALRGG
jgi:hypothetical protein